jgi:hypothetical protein
MHQDLCGAAAVLEDLLAFANPLRGALHLRLEDHVGQSARLKVTGITTRPFSLKQLI